MSKWICSRAALAALLAAGLISYTSSGQAGAQERPAAANQDDIGNPPADFGSDAKTEFRREPDAVERVLRGSTRVIADTAQAQGTDQQGAAQQQGAARAETAAQADRGGKTMPGDITLDQAHAALEAAGAQGGRDQHEDGHRDRRRRRQPEGLRPDGRAWLGSIDISIKKAKTARSRSAGQDRALEQGLGLRSRYFDAGGTMNTGDGGHRQRRQAQRHPAARPRRPVATPIRALERGPIENDTQKPRPAVLRLADPRVQRNVLPHIHPGDVKIG